MKKSITLFAIYLGFAACVCVAGKINLKDEPAIKAKVAMTKDADASVTWASIKDELQTATSNLDAVATAGITDTVAKKAIVDTKKATRDTVQALNKLVKKLKETERIEAGARQ